MIRLTIAALACTGLTACGGVSLGVPGAGGSGPLVGSGTNFLPTPPDVFVDDTNFASLINGYRNAEGVAPVTYNAQLDAAAQGHADDMLARNYFAHESPEGLLVEDRIRAQGYVPVNFGENIGTRQQDDAEVLEDWQNSAPHDRLLTAGTVDEFGLGVAGVGRNTRWVLVMASD